MSSNNNKINKKDLDDYSHDVNDVTDSKIIDDKFIKVFKFAAPTPLSKEPPEWLKKNIMSSYEKDYKYQILWHTVKMKAIEYKEALFANGRGLEIALASIVILFILGGIIYYQYTNSKSVNQTNQIAKEQNEMNQSQLKNISKTIRGSFVTDPRMLTSIKKIYLDVVGNNESFTDIQNQVTNELSRNNIFTITEKTDADAVLRFSLNSTNSEVFARLVDRKNHTIWSVNKSITNKSVGIEIVNILTKDINEVKNK